MKRRLAFSAWFGCVLLATAPAASNVWACPFCTVTSQTLSEEMASMDAAVVARLTKLPDTTKTPFAGDEGPKAVFEVTDILKGLSAPSQGKEIRAVVFGREKVGDRFLVMGAGRPDVAWTTPMKVSDRAVEYLRQLDKLPGKGPERLAFFQAYLEDPDQVLSRDAYDEFAKAPYSEVQGLRDKMNHEQLLAWIKNPDVPLNRRRLYMVMLSVCGGADDLPAMEQMLRSEDKKIRAGLDAMLGCYLMLAGPGGMGLVEDLFLKDPKAEYADTYAAIMALRFHGTEAERVPRERILQGFHLLLDRPELADLIIPDMARWEDWSQVERLVELFKEAGKKSGEARVQIINYLRTCPRPEAKEHLPELAKMDPQAFQRAETFFPLGGGNGAASSAFAAAGVSAAPPVKAEPPSSEATGDSAVASPTDPAGPIPILHRTAASDANPLTYLVVFWILGGVFFVALWAVLIGWGRGS